MTKELQKRIITSVILLTLLIIFNFSKFFAMGLLLVILFICIEFSELLSKLVGPMLIKHHRHSFNHEKINFKYLVLQILVIFYVLIVFGGSSFELHGRSGNPIFFLLASIRFLRELLFISQEKIKLIKTVDFSDFLFKEINKYQDGKPDPA